MEMIFTAALPLLVIALLCCLVRLKIGKRTRRALPEQGVVVDKDYIPARWVKVSIKGFEIPQYRCQRFCVALRYKDDAIGVVRWKSVSKREYYRCRVGDRYPTL